MAKQPSPQAHDPRKHIKLISILLVILVLLFILFAIGIPAILSTRWGQERIISHLNDKIPGTVSADRVQIGWFGSQTIHGLVLKDPDDSVVLTLDKMTVEASLMRLISKDQSAFKTQISGLNAKITQDQAGLTNLQKALGIKVNVPPSSLPYSFELQNVMVNIEPATHADPISLHISGTTLEGNQSGRFKIEALLRGFNPDQIDKIHAEIKNLPVGVLDQLVAINNPQLSGMLRAGLGQTIHATLDQNKAIEGIDLRLRAESLNLGMEFDGRLETDNFTLVSPGKIRLNLTQDLAAKYAGINIAQPLLIEATIDALQIPFTGFDADIEGLRLSAKASIEAAELSKVPVLGDVSVRKLVVNAQKDTQKSIKINIDGSVKQIADASNAFNQFDNYTPFKLTMTPRPTASTTGLRLSGLVAIGNLFNLNYEANFDKEAIGLDLKGIDFDAHAVVHQGDQVTLLDKAYLKFNFTPDQFALLRKHLNSAKESRNALALMETAKINLEIESLVIPQNWEQSSFAGEFKIDKVDVLDLETKEHLTLEPVKGHIKTANLAKDVAFDLRAHQKNQEGAPSEHFIAGNVHDVMRKDSLSLGMQSTLAQFPARVLCKIVCLEPSTRKKFEAIIGPVVDADINIRMQKQNGPVQARIVGVNGKAELDGQVNNGILTLNRPFSAEVSATKEFASNVLEDLVPILSGMINAEERFRLVIDPQGFSIPINNMALKNIHIGLMTVDLGKVVFNNEGQLAKVMSVLKASPQEMISVWFTPIYLNVHQGIIQIQRFDMLTMQRYPIAAWGHVDIPGDRIKMAIGLSGASLQQATGIPIPDKNYMMQFPLEGKLGRAKIDKSKLAGKIAALTAQITGGPQGLVIGTMIGLASGAYTEDKIPPPTTNPLPWKTTEEPANSETSQAESKPNPIKSIKKSANSLLQNLFK